MCESDKIAIIGMDLKVKGVHGIDDFWRIVMQGESTLRHYSKAELISLGVTPELRENPQYSPVATKLDHSYDFDNDFFDISAVEAAIMDPAQRIILESCYRALENAAVVAAHAQSKLGVFVGNDGDYRQSILAGAVSGQHGLLERLGNDADFSSTRISNKLDTTGPAVTVLAACATSLLAVKLAVESLRKGETDWAVAGGASIMNQNEFGYSNPEGGMFSTSGYLRPFDQRADGTIFSDGVATVVLRRLEDALADGSQIHAVISGVGASNDGNPPTKKSFTAPSVEGQMIAVENALHDAAINPETILYAECHGTGTAVGDPIEIEALTNVYRKHTDKQSFCTVGSVKGNFGHTKSAAGVVSLIKASLVLKHGIQPPIAGFAEPHESIDLTDSPFVFNNDIQHFKTSDQPIRACVSAFGFGGTNAHLILEQHQTDVVKSVPANASTALGDKKVVPLSAKNEAALQRKIFDLARAIEAQPALALDDICHTLAVGREAMNHRAYALVAEDQLTNFKCTQNEFVSATADAAKELVFLLPGQGAQYPGMAENLYRANHYFRSIIDQAADILKPDLGIDMRDLLCGVEHDQDTIAQLNNTAYAQPALFIIEYASAKLLMQAGVTPSVLFGHSVGELCAACLAGVFSFADGLSIMVKRSQLMQSCETGSMLAVILDADTLAKKLPSDLQIAAVNTPYMSVISGPEESIDKMECKLQDEGVATMAVNTSHAFHSHMMDPIINEFQAHIAAIPLSAPNIKMMSNISGDYLRAEQAQDPAYWASQIRHSVQFSAAAQRLCEQQRYMFLQLGPSQVLVEFIRRHDNQAMTAAMDSNDSSYQTEEDSDWLLHKLAGLWLSGAAINIDQLNATSEASKVVLPSYPLQRKYHKIAKDGEREKVRLPSYLYKPSWPQSDLDISGQTQMACVYLLFKDTLGLTDAVLPVLMNQGHRCVVVEQAEQYQCLAHDHYHVRVDELQDVQSVMKDVADKLEDAKCLRVLDFWSVTEPQDAFDAFEHLSCLGHNHLINLSHATAYFDAAVQIEITILVNDLLMLEHETVANVGKAPLLGIARHMPIDNARIRCRVLDISCPDYVQASSWLANAISDESVYNQNNSIALIRDGQRYEEELYYIPELARGRSRLRHGATVLITGGTGGIGLTLARQLYENYAAKLVLLSRSQFPDQQDWPARARSQDKIGTILSTLLQLKAEGAEILTLTVDVQDGVSLEQACRTAQQQFGKINAVFHAAGLVRAKLLHEEKALIPDGAKGKILGGMHLDRIFSDQPLDIFVLYSSVASHLLSVGMGVYSGANSALNTIAHNRNKRGLNDAFAISWDGWSKVGMAAQRAEDVVQGTKNISFEGSASGVQDFHHPLLTSKYDAHESVTNYVGLVKPDTHWIVPAHTLRQQPLLAAVVQVDMLQSVAADIFNDSPAVELVEVFFMLPIFISPAGINLRVSAETQTDGRVLASIQAIDLSDALENKQWVTHTTAELRACDVSTKQVPAELLQAVASVEDSPAPVSFGASEDGNGISGNASWSCYVDPIVWAEDGHYAARIKTFKQHSDMDRFYSTPMIIDQAGAYLKAQFFAGAFIPYRLASAKFFGRMDHTVYALGSLDDELTYSIDFSLFNIQGQHLVEISSYEARKFENSKLGVDPAQASIQADQVRKLRVEQIGDLDSLVMQPFSLSAPTADQVQIQVLATGINYRDVLTVLGSMPATPETLQWLGGECSGYVTAVGDNVSAYEVGDAVIAYTRGAYTSHINVDEERVFDLPDGVCLEDAAGIPIVFMTADYALIKQAQLQAGERVLIHSAAGGVGLAALQIAQAVGAEIYATAGTLEKRNYLKALGIEHVFDSRSLDFYDQVMAASNNQGVDVVLNSLAGQYQQRSLATLRAYGRFVELGKRDMLENNALQLRPFANNLTFYGLDLGPMYDDHGAMMRERMQALLERFRKRELVPIPTKVYPVEDANEVFKRMGRGEHVGKLVLKIGVHQDDWLASMKQFQSRYSLGISPDKAFETLQLLMSTDLPLNHVVANGTPIDSHFEDIETVEFSSSVTRTRDSSVPLKPAETETQIFLQDLWQQNIGIPEIGILDDFFDLGGDSLTSIQILSAIQRQYDFRLTTNDFVDNSTIEQLALIIDQQTQLTKSA